jgi:general nucleoside transport system permease protein
LPEFKTALPLQRLFISAFAFAVSLLIAAVFVLAAGKNPLEAYGEILSSGFGCRVIEDPHPLKFCALLNTLAIMTPMLLTGLSALVAFRGGFFSLGQAGQMLIGGALASNVANALHLPPLLHIALSLLGGTLGGAGWAWIPGLLRIRLGLSEVLTTLIFNALAGILGGWLAGWGSIDPAVRLVPLAFNTKLNAGLFIALMMLGSVYLYLWHSVPGYEQRMTGQAPLFAAAAGLPIRTAGIRAMLISGGLAGLAGAIDVMGVHYRFVMTFSGGDGFDGVAVAVLGQMHPIGVLIASFVLAGLRLGAMTGLQMHLNIPRELGNVIIAVALILVAGQRLQEAVLARSKRDEVTEE